MAIRGYSWPAGGSGTYLPEVKKERHRTMRIETTKPGEVRSMTPEDSYDNLFTLCITCNGAIHPKHHSIPESTCTEIYIESNQRTKPKALLMSNSRALKLRYTEDREVYISRPVEDKETI